MTELKKFHFCHKQENKNSTNNDFIKEAEAERMIDDV